MPDDQLQTTVQETKTTLLRADKEIAKLKEDMAKHAKCLRDSVNLAGQLAVNQQARLNLSKLSTMAIKLEGAYVKSSVALKEYADTSDGLRTTNIALSVCYLVMAVSKILDVIAQVTGTGKLITSAKSAVIDMAEANEKAKLEAQAKGQPGYGDAPGAAALCGAQAVNLALIAGKWVDVVNGVSELQKGLSAIIDLVKDLNAFLSAPSDLRKLKGDMTLWLTKLTEKIAKLADSVAKVMKLYEAYQGLEKQYNASKLFQLKKLEDYTAEKVRISDYISAGKYALEAVVNLSNMVSSIVDAAESWKASADANAQAERQLVARGTGAFKIDVNVLGRMSNAELIPAIHPVSSAPDARELAYNTGMKAKELAGEIDRMSKVYDQTLLRLAPVADDVNDDVAQVTITDGRLKNLRLELERRRGADPLKVAVALDLIDRERKEIAGLLATH